MTQNLYKISVWDGNRNADYYVKADSYDEAANHCRNLPAGWIWHVEDEAMGLKECEHDWVDMCRTNGPERITRFQRCSKCKVERPNESSPPNPGLECSA